VSKQVKKYKKYLTIVNTKNGGHVISWSEKKESNTLFSFIMGTPTAKRICTKSGT